MIGLDTGHLVYNYGTKLQAYAMQTLLEQSGEKVEIIQWHQKDYKFLNGIADNVKTLKKTYQRYGFKFTYGLKALKRYKKLDEFNQKFNIHKFYCSFEEMKENTKIYSSMFCGSDQAWLPNNIINHMYTLEFCGDETYKAAYAPSFGIDEIEEKYRDSYVNFLSRMDMISTREISGQKIVKDLIGKEIPVVLDPTLLLTPKEWNKLKDEATVKIPTNEKYVFCYLLGRSKEHREKIKAFAKSKCYKIINLQHFMGYTDSDENFADYNLYEVSPQDFIKLISKATYVCTDSFHCTAFSIQYHKNFTVFHRFKKKDKASTNSRLYSLLGQLGLEQRLVTDEADVCEEKISFDFVDEKLNKLRVFSGNYMKKALEKSKQI